MSVDRKPFSSCINFVNVALIWQLLMFPLSGKFSIAVQMITVVKIPTTYNFEDFCQTKSRYNERNIAVKFNSSKVRRPESCVVDIGILQRM